MRTDDQEWLSEDGVPSCDQWGFDAFLHRYRLGMVDAMSQHLDQCSQRSLSSAGATSYRACQGVL